MLETSHSFMKEGSIHEIQPSQNTIYFLLLNIVGKASKMANRDRENSFNLITESFRTLWQVCLSSFVFPPWNIIQIQFWNIYLAVKSTSGNEDNSRQLSSRHQPFSYFN